MSVARAVVRPDWLTRERFSFESRFAEIAGNTVHYVDEGAGPTLLMLHGNPTWSFVYRHTIGLLRDRFRCIALDCPGFGLSIASENYDHLPESHMTVVEQFVDCIGLGEFTPVVQDWGVPWGDKDIASREKERARFATIFPRARTIALSGAGHYVQEESPAEIAAAIRAWWPAEVEAEK